MRNKFMVILMMCFFFAGMVSPVLAASMYQGRPAPVGSDASEGYFVWQDGDRWHVQAVNIGPRRLFTGMVETDGAFSDVSAMPSEKSERMAIKVRKQKIEFKFNSLANTDGFSFTVLNSENARFTFYIDGRPVDPSNIYLGHQNRHPNSYSFPMNSSTHYSYSDGSSEPLQLQGQPTAMNPGNVLGYFIWQESGRWFLKTSTRGLQRQFAGTIRTGGTFANVTRLNLEDNDIVMLNETSDQIRFDLKTEGEQDGISFQFNDSMDATLTLYLDGQTINPSNVYLGSQNVHPTVNPFSISSRDGQYTLKDDRVLPSDDQIYSDMRYQTLVSSYAQGKPSKLNPGKVFGYFIWQDDENRWHLQTTATGSQRNFTGTIETNGTISDVRTLRSKRTDENQADTMGSDQINFSFMNGVRDQHDKLSGLSFSVTDGSDLRFRLYVDGKPVDPANIHLGRENHHPSGSAIKIYSSNQ